MDNGASGYVLKNATQEELMEPIETVASGKIYLVSARKLCIFCFDSSIIF